MCLLELKKSPKPIVSCAMTAKSCLNNGAIHTNSPLVKKARENVLEFLLLNHPLDCPICDQGGECDLQDQSFFFGLSKKRFYSYKRIVSDKNIGPIVKTVMTRCIHCTRCVRFASDIADSDSLGVFGRGLHSEIGTYVTKIFSSELSGNVIDLCPVGALTSKPYPFVQRSWELKSVNSIDFSDGFGENLQIYLKNNKIVKVLPGYNVSTKSINWITNKTRFSFDSMFSPERQLQGFICTKKNKTPFFSNWKALFNEIMICLYFQDHLNKHFLTINALIIVFSNTLSIEVLNLLLVLARKYSFILLKTLEPFKINTDLESNFITNLLSKPLNLASSDLCLLISINTRYESSFLNLKLRQRFLKGNFKILSLGSLLDLPFFSAYLGANSKSIRTITEGNHFFCQELTSYINPLLVSSSELFQRKDSHSFFNLLQNIQQNINLTTANNSRTNIISSSVNTVGLNYLDVFPSFSATDLKNSYGIFFLNTNFIAANLKKIIEFKLLNYFRTENDLAKVLIDQNNTAQNSFFENLQKSYNIYSYLFLPAKVFFETNGTYTTTEGIFKKSTRITSSEEKQPKENWQIIRKIFSCSKNISFLSNFKDNTRIIFNANSQYNFQNFITFQNYATHSLTPINFQSNTGSCFILPESVKKFFLPQPAKTFETKLQYWLDDFYLKGKESSARFSAVNIKSSKLLLKNSTNFI